MKVWIDADEYYPFYTLTADESLIFPRNERHVSEEFKAIYDRVMKEFIALQADLKILDDKKVIP